ncbi:MAG: xanthine dehydrogenase family protein subunit M [Actinomycetota bacterium]|nr:xanthine dehydrogenase family protein subunit M [Actinomycetota bacterium]
MKPSPFTYHAPESIAEATALLAELGDDAKALAGGQSLVPMLSLRLAAFEHLVDLNRVAGLNAIERVNGHLRLGATVRQATAEHSAEVKSSVPLLARALPHIGHFQIRNRGTVGGSIAHADPASELPAVALALDAVIEAAGPGGTRRIAASDFFVSTWETALNDGEILSAVEFPVWSGRCGFAVEELTRRHGDFAIVGTAVGVQVDGDAVTKATIALFGVGATPLRASEAEAALMAGADVAEVARAATAGLTPSDDVHASGAYRTQVAAVMVRRALTKAIQEARA